MPVPKGHGYVPISPVQKFPDSAIPPAASSATGIAPPVAYTLSADPATVTITGNTASLVLGRVLTGSPGTVTITGSPTTPVVARVLTGSPGTFTVTGASATPVPTLPGSATSYAITGAPATLTVQRVLSGSPATLSVTGSPATPVPSTPGTAASFTITGSAASLVVHRVASLSLATFTVTGDSATLAFVRGGFTASPGSVSITGSSATFIAPTRNIGSSATGGRLEDELYALLRNDDEVVALVASLL